ncbi:MAG TPA: TonB family protein [Thermoanaerobaculia bacterium]|nr:TonB family protein [Thermoanaerobaculia bacterium]
MTLRLDRKLSRTLSSAEPKERGLALGVPQFLLAAEEDRRPLVWGWAVAFALHVVLLLVTLPQLRQEIRTADRAPKAYVIQAVRFKPPEPTQAQTPPPRPKARKVPIPDPTPDLPEPILDERYDIPQIELPEIGDSWALSSIPDAPPLPGGGPGAALQLGGDIAAPVKVFGPQPGYTEDARQARIQGVVILQAIIDVLGNVTQIKVLKGLPEGLAESAVATVQTWRFKPAMLDGEPVPVYYNFTVNFSLQ